MKLVKEKIKKFIPLLLLFSIFLGIFLPSLVAAVPWWAWIAPPVGAAWWIAEQIAAPIGGALSDVATGFLQAISNLIILGIAKLLDIVYGVLLWIISEDFLGISMTGPDNPLVYNGWTYVRDLANIFLVLGLIIIALGIILGIKEYEAKKTLPILIIIALLINFTPVICGAIIDFSNHLMQWLLKGGFDSDKGLYTAIQQGLKMAGKKGPLEAILDALVYIIFGLISIVVIFLYCLLFLMRYVFLWILIIFSPIAFASRVFGGNKYLKMLFPGFLEWNNWWSSFIQWCIIGVFGAFFLFLANKLMTEWAIPADKFSSEGATWLGGLYMCIFPLLLLIIGFFATLEAAQAGMAVLPGMEKMTKFAAAQAVKGTVKGTKKISEAIPEKARRWGERQARRLPLGALYGKGESGKMGWGKRQLGKAAMTITSPIWMSRRAIGRTLSAGMEAQVNDIARAEKESVGMTVEQKLRRYNASSLRGERTGFLQGIIRDHEIDDARAIMPEKERDRFDKNIKAQMGEAAMMSRGSFMKIARAFPQYVDEVAGKLSPGIREKMLLPEEDELVNQGFIWETGEKKGKACYGRYIINGMKPEHVKYMDSQVLSESPEEREKAKKVKEEIQKKKGEGEKIEEEKKKVKEKITAKTTDISEREKAGETERELRIPKLEKLRLEQTLEELKGGTKGVERALKGLEEKLKATRGARGEAYDQIHKSWAGYHDEELIKTFKRPAADQYMETAKNEKGMFWYVVNNPQNATYLASIFAPESGFFAPEGVTLPEINDWRERINKFEPQQMKQLQAAIEKLSIETRRALTQFLRIDPKRIETLRGADAGTIKGKVEEWKKEPKKEPEKGKQTKLSEF